MSSKHNWPSLEGWEATRDTLHAYARVAGAPARVLAKPHPKWWHVSLEVTEQGLLSDVMRHDALPGQELRTLLNLQSHSLDLLINGQMTNSFELANHDSATMLGEKLEQAIGDLGVAVDLPKKKYADDRPREYNPEIARRYVIALNSIKGVMHSLRDDLEGERSPVQLWPHHFDLAFEWFGTKVVAYEEDGEQHESPAQLNFGFAPGDSNYADPYFYSNPWPFDKKLTTEPLPHEARWFTDGFEGSLLPYKEIAHGKQVADKLLAYYRKVFELAKPTLIG